MARRWRAAWALIAVVSGSGLAAAQERVPEPPDVELRPVTVRFRADVAGLRVLYAQDPVLDEGASGLVVRAAPTSRYAELCVAPCDAELPQTHLGLAVARAGRVHRFETPLGLDGPTGVRFAWDDRSELRLAGVIALVAGAAVAVLAGGLTLGLATTDAEYAAGLSTSGLLLAASLGVGLALALLEDSVSFSVTPLPADGATLYSAEWR
ncbi:MAG: hypothetical protein KF729_18835 [Sandaracinaceae bacterium]|nr:hypothetical protein [Sandaracinaceae bacterium]